jgi:carboxyl-terminal processing protease
VWISDRHTAYYGRKRFDLVREETLAAHLQHESAASQQITAGPLYFLQQGSTEPQSSANPKLESAATSEDQKLRQRQELLMKDPELRIARDLILWAPSPDRAQLLELLPQFAADRSQQEGERIEASLSTTGVDWSAPPRASQTPSPLSVKIWSDRPDNVIPAGEKATVTMQVTNLGSETAYRVRAFSDSDNGYYDEREMLFGRIDAGQSKQATLRIAAANHELSRRDLIDFEVDAASGAALTADSDHAITVGISGRERPDFAFGYQLVDDPRLGEGISGDADGLLDPGERAEVRVWVTNRGNGEALSTQVRVRSRARSRLFLDRSRVRLASLAHSEMKEASFPIELREDPGQPFAELDITVSDNKVGEFLTQHVRLPIDRGPGLSELEGRYSNSESLTLLDSAESDAHILARVEAGRVFKIDGRIGEFGRIRLPGDRVAFARLSELQRSESGPPLEAQDISWSYAISPPLVEVDSLPTEASNGHIVVSGEVSADDLVRDVYITVHNPARDLLGRPQKVFYLANLDAEGSAMKFSAEVPLQPGNNLIEVFARGRGDIVGWSRHWVLSSDGLRELRAAEPTPTLTP